MKDTFAHITTPSGMTLFFSGRAVKVDKGTVFHQKVLDLFDDGVGPETMAEEIQALLDRQDIKEAGFEGDSYKGDRLNPVLAQKLQSIKDAGAPVDGLVEFFNRLNQNPSSSSILELYDFLAYKELPITEDGYFLAYKGVGEDYYSVRGGGTQMEDHVTVDNQGRVYNGVGEKPRVKSRGLVDDDRSRGCSFGLHVGSADYAREWGSKVVVVKVDPADVVSVPSDSACQKLRTVGYEVLYDYEKEIVAPVVSERGEVAEMKTSVEFHNRVDGYLDKKAQEGEREVSIQAIQNSFSPEYPSRERVLDTLQDLGKDFDSKFVYL